MKWGERDELALVSQRNLTFSSQTMFSIDLCSLSIHLLLMYSMWVYVF